MKTEHPTGAAMADNAALLVATRIHHALMRHLGSGIEDDEMLQREAYAREVLFVCEGCGDAELQALGVQFRQARGPWPAAEADAEPLPPEEEDEDAFASGFGDEGEPPPAQASPWARLRRWLRARRGARQT